MVSLRVPKLPYLKILGGLAVVLVVVGLVPPLRKAAALGTSKVILLVASPLAPGIADFETLPETTRVLAADGSVIAELDKAQRRVPIELGQLPLTVRRAVLAAEDADFYEHAGINPSSVFRAFLSTARGRTQGGSTITQQLAKINYTARERTLLRKLKEVLYASRLERRYTKDQLLERYLNQIYFGAGAYGLNSAAQTYFGIDAPQLSAAQAATLAGKIRSPEGLDPRKDPAPVVRRRDQVLESMRTQQWLSEAEFQAAKATQLELAPAQAVSGAFKAPHFVEYVKREARTIDALGSTPETRRTQLFTGGYTIETTLEPKVFDATEVSVRQRLGIEGDPFTAVATVVPGNGAITSLFGGLDFATSQFDMSSLAGRQAGSAFKPFVYLAAIRKGIDPRTTFDGTSGRVIPCYGPDPVDNYAGEDLGGAITVDEAMVSSVNVVFVELGCKVGPGEVVRTAVEAGIPADATNAQGAVFLGGLDGKGVNALEMANAYATVAANGTYAEPYAIARIKDHAGRVLYEHKVKTKSAFKPAEVQVLNGALQGVVQRGTARAADIGRPVAGKTGTTQDNVDGWFVGYTPDLATAVWVGYGENRPMTNVHGRAVTGGSFPAQVFADVMKKALEGIPSRSLPTLSPDQLGLKVEVPPPPTTVAPSTTTTPATTTSTTATPATTTTMPATTTPTTTTAPRPTTTAPPAPTATNPPGTTTTTAPPATTSTTTTTVR